MPISLAYLCYVVGVVLLLVALFAFLGVLHVGWTTFLIAGVILVVLGYLLARRGPVSRL